MLGADTNPDEMIRGIGFWIEHGRHKVGPDDAPRLDDAQAAFEKWLEKDSELREKTQTGLRHALRQLVRARGNAKLGDLTSDTIHAHLDARPISNWSRRTTSGERCRGFSVGASSGRGNGCGSTPAPPSALGEKIKEGNLQRSCPSNYAKS